jgi:hypothetical protein
MCKCSWILFTNAAKRQREKKQVIEARMYLRG